MTTAMTNIGANLSLKPVGYSTKTEGSETKVVMKTPQYGLDGRVAKLVDMAQEYISAYDGVTTPSGGISIFKQTEDTDEADALALSFWLRANANVSLQLSEGTYRADDGTNTAGTVNAESGLGSTLTLTLPQEAVDAAESIDNELYNYCNCALDSLYNSLYYYRLQYEDEGRAPYIAQWKSTRAAMEEYIQQHIGGGPLQYNFKVVFYDSDFIEIYSASLDEVEHYMALSQDEQTLGSSLYDPLNDCFTFQVKHELSLSDQLLRLLNKTRLRFIVTSEEGQQELMARIVPYTTYQDIARDSHLNSDYFDFIIDGDTVSMGFLDCNYCITGNRQIIELMHHQSGDDKFTFKLAFYTTETAGYTELAEALNNSVSVYRLAYQMENYESHREMVMDMVRSDIDIIKDKVDAMTSEEFAVYLDDLVEAFLEHLTKTADEKLAACQMALPHIDLTANEAKKVDVYMYLDGEAVTNADAATIDGLDLALNLQFEKIGGATNAMTGRVYEEESESESGSDD